jgi:hypothetical protein
MRRRSPTSAWRRSISSKKKTSQTPGQAYNLLLCEQAAAADTAAEAAGAAPAFEAAEALALPAALEAAALESGAAAAGEVAAAAAAAGVGAGVAAAAGRGEVAPSGARLEGLAITLAQGVMPGFDHVSTGRGFCLQRFPGDVRVWRTKSGGTYRETLARELDDGALAAREYALRWDLELRRKCVY